MVESGDTEMTGSFPVNASGGVLVVEPDRRVGDAALRGGRAPGARAGRRAPGRRRPHRARPGLRRRRPVLRHGHPPLPARLEALRPRKNSQQLGRKVGARAHLRPRQLGVIPARGAAFAPNCWEGFGVMLGENDVLPGWGRAGSAGAVDRVGTRAGERDGQRRVHRGAADRARGFVAEGVLHVLSQQGRRPARAAR